MKPPLIILFFLISFQCIASNDDADIYAHGDGTYSYLGKTYSLKDFPIKKVTIIGNKVQIFPADNLDFNKSLVSVRPLARKFIKLGYEVETKIMGKVIPYIVKR